MEPENDGFHKGSPFPGCHFQVLCQSSGVYHIARQGEPPAKDPSNSQAYIQTYIQAYIQNKAEAIHTNLRTSIYIKQSRRNTYKHIHKTKQESPPNSTPEAKQHQKILPYKIVSIV